MSIPQKAPGRCRRLRAERRQLTAVVSRSGGGGTPRPLDPEELHQVIQDVQRVCDQIIQRFDGWMAQHFGDGFVVYFDTLARMKTMPAGLPIRRWRSGSMARLSQEFKKQHGVEFIAGGDSHGHSGVQRPWQW